MPPKRAHEPIGEEMEQARAKMRAHLAGTPFSGNPIELMVYNPHAVTRDAFFAYNVSLDDLVEGINAMFKEAQKALVDYFKALNRIEPNEDGTYTIMGHLFQELPQSYEEVRSMFHAAAYKALGRLFPSLQHLDRWITAARIGEIRGILSFTSSMKA